MIIRRIAFGLDVKLQEVKSVESVIENFCLCNIRPNTTQRWSVEKVLINDWQASVTLILLVFHRLDLASCFSGLSRAK